MSALTALSARLRAVEVLFSARDALWRPTLTTLRQPSCEQGNCWRRPRVTAVLCAIGGVVEIKTRCGLAAVSGIVGRVKPFDTGPQILPMSPNIDTKLQSAVRGFSVL